MGVDRVKSGTKAWAKRQALHRHNGFQGTVTFSLQGMHSILASSTATKEAKELAQEIYGKLQVLRGYLSWRMEEGQKVPNKSEKTQKRQETRARNKERREAEWEAHLDDVFE